MQKKIFLFALLLVPNIFSAAPNYLVPPSKRIVLDQVIAVTSYSDRPDLGSKDDDLDEIAIITQQDIARMAFDGQNHTVEDAVYKQILCAKADSLKMSMSNEEVIENLEKVGMPHDQQLLMVERWHYYDLDEFLQTVRKIYVSGMSQSFEVESRLVITQAEIDDYYQKNPVWLEPEFELVTSFVPFSNEQEKTKLKYKLEKFLITHKGYNVEWSDSFVIRESEISDENLFLKSLKTNQIYLKEVEQGFDLFKMVEIRPKRLQPLIERRNQIVNYLRNERYPAVLEQVQQDLLQKAVVYYPKHF
jgi:hypothetical protein